MGLFAEANFDVGLFCETHLAAEATDRLQRRLVGLGWSSVFNVSSVSEISRIRRLNSIGASCGASSRIVARTEAHIVYPKAFRTSPLRIAAPGNA